MDRKGFELAISTVILIILGIAVLIGLILFVKKGFGFLDNGTDPLIDTEKLGIIRQACEIACRGNDANTFCCSSFDMDNNKLFCINHSVGIDCQIDCSEVICS